MSEESRIRLLPEHIIDQIKAGEVIERPASLIKEILENSIDAGADKIDLHIVENGLELIHLRDNGKGMFFEDLPYAFCRHATSKISSFEDLYRLHSFGFRGEALASISSISRVTCTSVPKDSPDQGGKIIIHGGETLAHEPFKEKQTGTNFYIKDLFYNTPARLKFVKSKIAEKNAIKRIVYAFILTNPQISFSLKWDDKEKEFFPRVETDQIEKRYRKFFFKKKDQNTPLYFFEGEYEDHIVQGCFSEDSSKSGAGKQQYLFANGRLFTDKSLHQTIIRNLEALWGPQKSGHYVLNIFVPPSKIDVNVHPNKTYIKFFKQSLIYSLLSGVLKESIPKKEVNPGHSLPNFANEQSAPRDLREDLQMTLGAETTVIAPSVTQPQEQRNNLEKLTDSFFVINEGEKRFLLNAKRVVREHLKLEWSKFESFKDDDLTPLLISEPFKFTSSQISESDLVKLKNKGLEFDRLSDEVIVLRTIPSFLEPFDLQPTILALLNSFSKKSNDWGETLNAMGFLNFNYSQTVALIVKLRSLSFLKESGAAKEITNELFESLF